MAGVYPKLPRVAVRDSFDDEDLSDVDDEVFIRDGKNGILKIDDDSVMKRPLMAPRRKCKAHFSESSQVPYKTLFAPFCYTLLGLLTVLGIVILCIIIVTKFPLPLTLWRNWFSHEKEDTFDKQHIVPCTSLNSKIQWTRTIPKLTSEAPLRSNDVNGDSIEDIIVGFSTGLDKPDAPDYVCTMYFDQKAPCLGGVLALNGKSGETIWTHWTPHAVFAVDCGLDLNGDNVKDCVIAGRGGILHAINGQDGTSIWEVPPKDLSLMQKYYDIYDVRYIADVDYDGVGDVVASHTWQSDGRRSEIILLSGKNGNKINSMNFPGNEQLFVAPEVIVHPDGETYFVLVANDQHKSGGLYIIPHSQLLKGDYKLLELHHGEGKGISLPPLLIDLNSDGTEDIIVAVFNATIMAFDGRTFKELWNFTIPNSEVISIPVPGYYNDDKVPDFMVKHQIGPGFPVYYYTTATILDGKTGKPLLEAPMEDTLSAQLSGLSVTVDGYGNDWFLHWSANCLNHEGEKDKYKFLNMKDANTDADLCKLRFNSTLVTSLFAFSQHVEPPGLPLYRSPNWEKLEFKFTVDPRQEAEDYTNSHSDFSNTQEEIVSNKSPDEPIIQNDNVNNNNIRHKNVENNDFQEIQNYYPGPKSIKYDNSGDEQPPEIFLDKALDELNDEEWKNNNKWENDKPEENNIQTDDTYDEAYDDEDDRMIASRQLNEIRLQRSEKNNVRYINNDTNDVENQLDPSMDYTNGQSKQNNYYSSLPFNRSNNVEDSSDYMNIPDIDFVDNIKDAEALDDRRKRAALESQNESKQNKASKVDKKYTKVKTRSPIAKLIEDYRIAKFLKRLKRQNKMDDSDPWIKPSGMQRQPPTGILLPSLNTDKNSVDLIFSTYWLPPAMTPFVLLQQDLRCIEVTEKKSEKKLSAEDKETIISNCLAARGVNYQSYQEATDKENAKIALGQMTIYRMQLQCSCPEDMLPGQTCKDISKQQSWPQHLGALGSGYFEPLRK